MRTVFLLFLMVYSISTIGQDQDSSIHIDETLDYTTFMELVKNHHPLAMNAQLQSDLGEMNLRANRGGFDPKLYADVSQKYFDELQYYSHQEGGIVVPTWLGIEVESGYQNNDGTYLNPEEFVPDDGLWWAGLSVPIGRDLFIDSRRAALRKAQLYQKGTVIERRLMLNDLLVEAGQAYWDWFASYNAFRVLDEAVQVVQTRYDNTLIGAKLGEQANIDTVESKIQLFNRKAKYQEARAKYLNTQVLLSTFLWDKGQIPLVLRSDVRPPEILNMDPVPSSTIYEDSLLNNHPMLQYNRLKIDQLEIDRRLKAEQIKPKLDLKYRALQTAWEYDREGAGILNDNYSWGLSFSFPILIRKERGELQKMKIMLQQSENEFFSKRQELQFKLRKAINDWDASARQAELYRDASLDYQRLLEAEQRLFNVGESSVFMVNSRELGYISAQLNWIKSMADNRISELDTYYMLGILSDR